MKQPDALTVIVEVDRGSTPVSGSVRVAAQPARPFVGWVDLVRMLEEARASAAAAAQG